MSVTVKVLTDGPLIVTGECKVEDAQGNPIPAKAGDSIALCRCGASANKPFCDGAHKTCGFVGNEGAPGPKANPPAPPEGTVL